VEALDRIAKKYNLKLIYDAAHAYGVEYKGKSLVSFGDISTLSFHATKTFHTIEGGAIIVNAPGYFNIVKQMRNFGIVSEEEVLTAGINAKMNEFQAAMGLSNFPGYETRRKRNQRIYALYESEFRSREGLRMQKLVISKHNYTYFPIVVRSKVERDGLYASLLRSGIHARKYFYPLTTDARVFPRGKLNPYTRDHLVTARYISDRVLCLPLYADLPLRDAKRVVKAVKSFLR
jgi:dTDP-4-amino-4,6-dideoxygalactose transaminase